jgi:uncharacterized protein YvpB
MTFISHTFLTVWHAPITYTIEEYDDFFYDATSYTIDDVDTKIRKSDLKNLLWSTLR